jgi:predicted anti-sigma-YlaC factor YlaD
MNVMSGKISCKQAVDYISKKEEGKLTTGQRFKLWRHLAECSLCRIFSVQNKIIAQAMAQKESRELTVTEKEALVKAVLEAEK